MDKILLVLLVVIALTIIINTILKRFNLPTIIGYIFVGMAVTKLYQVTTGDKVLLSHISEFGIVFLMFTIGLEFSINHLKSMKKELFLYGSLQMVIITTIFSLICIFFLHFDIAISIIIGSTISLSSTAIIIKMLEEKGDLQRQYGRKSLGILLFQDIAVIPILLMISIIATKNNDITQLLLKTSYSAFIVFVVIFFIGKYILNSFLKIITSLKTYEIFIASIFLIVVGSSYIAHHFGFSYTLGAFLSGMTLAETKYKYQIEADLIPFRDILLGVFFITVGMQINFHILNQDIFIIFGITIFIMSVKFLSLFVALSFFAQKRTALKTALTLCQIGEFSIVIIELMMSKEVIEPHIAQLLLISVIFSMIISPFIVKNVRFLSDILSHEEINNIDFCINETQLKNHIILCGYGTLGQLIAKDLYEKGIKFIVVEHDIKLIKEASKKGYLCIFGNAATPHIIKTLNPKSAISAIVAIENEEKLQIVCKALRDFSKELNIVARLKDEQSRYLIEDDVDRIVLAPNLIASFIVDEAIKCRLA